MFTKFDYERMEQYKLYLQSREKSPATIEKYIRDIKAFVSFVGERELEREVVLEYKAFLADRYAVSSANSMIAALNSYLRFCSRSEWTCKHTAVTRNRQVYLFLTVFALLRLLFREKHFVRSESIKMLATCLYNGGKVWPEIRSKLNRSPSFRMMGNYNFYEYISKIYARGERENP